MYTMSENEEPDWLAELAKGGDAVRRKIERLVQGAEQFVRESPEASTGAGPVAQISSGSNPCCAGGETGQSSDMAAGAPHSAGVPALATAATSTTQSAAAGIKRIPHPRGGC